MGIASGMHAAMARDDGLPFPTAGRPALRITDEAIAADRAATRALQARLNALRARGRTLDRYQLAKAQAWLEFAVLEYSQNDRTGVIEAAIEQAIHLLRGLESGIATLSRDTPIIRGSRLVREDLWSQVRVLKAADMSAAGKLKLDELAIKVGQAVQSESIVITGHTDRLGGVAINQKRSTARARAVQEYLAARGVPMTSMQAIGVGATKPLVSCKGIVATPALIACLQANRRVEIEVGGIRPHERTVPADVSRP